MCTEQTNAKLTRVPTFSALKRCGNIYFEVGVGWFGLLACLCCLLLAAVGRHDLYVPPSVRGLPALALVRSLRRLSPLFWHRLTFCVLSFLAHWLTRSLAAAFLLPVFSTARF
jgi:hypothetical protein